jgi:hypothetical protein
MIPLTLLFAAPLQVSGLVGAFVPQGWADLNESFLRCFGMPCELACNAKLIRKVCVVELAASIALIAAHFTFGI